MKKLRSKNIYFASLLLCALVLLLIVFCFPIENNAYAESAYVSENKITLHSDYYYDNDDGNYKTSNSILHNEWSHFFDLSLVSAGEFTKNGSTYTTKSHSPMALKIDGTWNYTAIHNSGKNDGNDGMHHYSYDSNGSVNGSPVKGGLVIIEYFTSSGTVYSIQPETLWQRDLSIPIEFPLTYHNGIKIRVKLCYELWKIQNGKTLYWNITQYSAPVYLKTSISLYDKQLSPAVSYKYKSDDLSNTQKALEKPLKIVGYNLATSTNPSVHLELQCDYFTMPVNKTIYEGGDGLNLLISATEANWWYTLESDSYIQVNGTKLNWAVTPTGIYSVKLDGISSSTLFIKVRINILFHFTSYMRIFWGRVASNSETDRGYLEYNYSIPLSCSNVNDGAILFYDDIATNTNYSNVSLVENGMVRSTNTLGIVSTSKINKYSVKVEKQENGYWREARDSEYTITTPTGTNNRRIIFRCTEAIERFRVTALDNAGKKNSRDFYIVSDIEKAVTLNLSNEQYNAINNLPWVKTLNDHKVACLFPELIEETTQQTPISNGIRVIKKITLGNYQNGNYTGNKHEFTYEFYVGAVAAPRLNSIKFQSAKYHLLPESYSVKEGTKVYAFKNYEDARAFLSSILKSNYSKPTSLSQGIQDKATFDSDIESKIVYNSSQHGLIEQANGDFDAIYVATNAQAPLDEQILMFEDDFWGLSKTDAVSISFQSSKGNCSYSYAYGKKLTASVIASKLGYDEQIQVTETYYDGTRLSYTVVIQPGNNPVK